jgi:hypothetical protein
MGWQKGSASTALSTGVAVALAGSLLAAHHSIVGLFDERRSVEISGVLTDFRFVEPHGVISVEIRNQHGHNEIWRAETNGPTLLGRRGWTKDSLKVGEAVTVEGFPAQGGARRLRMRKVTRADGTVLLGTPPPRAPRP